MKSLTNFGSTTGAMRLKAYSSRCMVGFLAVVFKALFEQLPNPSLDLTLVTKSVLLLAKWCAKLELHPYTLTQSQTNELYDLGTQLFGSNTLTNCPAQPRSVRTYLLFATHHAHQGNLRAAA